MKAECAASGSLFAMVDRRITTSGMCMYVYRVCVCARFHVWCVGVCACACICDAVCICMCECEAL